MNGPITALAAALPQWKVTRMPTLVGIRQALTVDAGRVRKALRDRGTIISPLQDVTCETLSVIAQSALCSHGDHSPSSQTPWETLSVARRVPPENVTVHGGD